MLLAEGENPVSLVILRSLRMKDIDAVMLASFSRCLSRFSRYCNQMILVPSMARMNEYAKAVEKIVKNVKFNVFFPVFEWSLLPISKNRDKISSYVKLPIASHESILKCFDKLSTTKLAIENDIPIPQTYFVHNSAELKKISKEITYPAVVKPRWSIIWKNDRAFHKRSGFVNSDAELVATYNSIHQYFPFPLIQEYVPGVNYSVASLYNEGKPRAFCCIKVPRAWPPTGGNSCFRESVPLNSEMRNYSEKLLNALDWHGIAEVEFRLDSRDNVPRLMEINPRFWGSLSVAVKAGVDLPYLLYRMTMDGDVQGVFNYKVGVKGRYFEHDLLHMVSLLTNASPTSCVWDRKRLKVLEDWLKFYEPGIFYDLFEFDDPIPFLFSLVSSPLGLLKFLRERSYAWSPPGVRF